MSEPLLTAVDVHKSYRSGADRLEVLIGSNLEVAVAERVAIVGQSGVGKSTLLHLLAGLDRPDSGSINYRGRALQELEPSELAGFRNRHVGMVFQFYHLLPEFTAAENVMMPMLIGGRADEAVDRAATLLEEVGLADRAHHFPSELSGGEQQRVAFARALACAPGLLLADEPTGNLDQESGERVMEVFVRLHAAHQMAMVMVTHNPDLVVDFDRVLVMEPGGHLKPRDER